ncbi:MAG: radical SAM protein [Acetobacterium woodii]|nr:radical SAM protein [Acetobacterium woodii]MBI5677817.1 radical SAM protein [Planctomycetota bacterium]
MDSKIKLLRYFDRVQGILDGEFLPPIVADVDLVNGLCNLNCEWCCQRGSQETKKTTFMPMDTIKKMGLFCKKWGVKSWRIAGDSEPTLNPNIHYLFRSGHEHGISMGLITNGVLLDKVKDLHLLSWLGVSLDAATAKTWSQLKGSPEKNFYRIIDNIKRIHDSIPGLEVSIKFIRWSDEIHLGRKELSPNLTAKHKKKPTPGRQKDNYADAEMLPQFAKELGCKYILRDAFPKDTARQYRFEVCRGTPLYATFGADHKFYLCCDVRTGYILTDDYTKNDWHELYDLWGSQKHKDLIASINPKKCKFCSKEWLNTIIENIILDGKYSNEYQVNFI